MSTPPSPSPPPVVLVAEDEHLVAQALCGELCDLGYTVLGPFATGAAAVDAARQHAPSLAVLDIRLPDMEGLEVAAVLRELDVPVVIASAYSDHRYLDASVEAGVFGYLLKPIGRDELRVALGVALARAAESRAMHDRVSTLEQRLADRKVIERAKALLQERMGLTEPEAMRRLQKQSRDARRPMVELAQVLLDAEAVMAGKAGGDAGE